MTNDPEILSIPVNETPSGAFYPERPFMRSVMDDICHNPGAEIVRYARRRGDILSLAMGESNDTTPRFICEAAQKAMMDGYTFYGPVLGRLELRQALADYYAEIYGITMPQQRIAVTSSGTSAMHLAFTTVLERGDEVVAVMPLWKNLMGAVRLAQARVRGVDLTLDPEQGWVLDLDRLFDTVTPHTRVILINSPNNPTGWVMPDAQIKAVMDFARQRGIWVISDEVYGRLVFDGLRAPSFLDHAGDEDRLFVINSFSKNWSMTGWRLGWLVGPRQAEDKIYDLVLYDNMGPPNYTQFGALAALKEGEPFLAGQLERFRANRDYVFERFAKIGGIAAARPRSSFYAFFRREDEPNCMDFARRLIDEQGLGLAPGCAFGQNFKGYMRLCYAVEPHLLEKAMDKFEAGCLRRT